MEALDVPFVIRVAVAMESLRPSGCVTIRLREALEVCAGEPESVTTKLRLTVPTAVTNGVPLIRPRESNVSPAGKVPMPRVHAYGGVPPIAASPALYTRPPAALVRTEVCAAS